MVWHHLGSHQKSNADTMNLVQGVMLAKDYDAQHLENFDIQRANRQLDAAADAQGTEGGAFGSQGGWKETTLKIKVPAPKGVGVAEKDAAVYEVPGFRYRPLIEVMDEAFQSPGFMDLHLTPFEARWDPSAGADGEPSSQAYSPTSKLNEYGLPVCPDGHQELYGEIYMSPKMLAAHKALPQREPYLETVVVAWLFYSDATQLANFGNASLWPLYSFFANLSKYIRGRPKAHPGRHQAYFLSLPASFKEWYTQQFGVAPSA
ncbi:hypothetical protein FB45DRAFT_1104863, partial [Roridomyces roridus]